MINGTEGNDTITVSYSHNLIEGSRLTYRVNAGPLIVAFPSSQWIQINGLGGHDQVRVSGSGGVLINGGEGNDTIVGGSGADAIGGGNGSDIINGGLGADNISGGAGIDTVDYSTRNVPVRVVLEGVAFDGQAGEGDNVANDIEVILGGSSNDYLSVGNTLGGYQKIVGNGGNDEIHGAYGHEILIGGPGDDVITGNRGDDYIIGEDGNDTIHGSEGTDMLSGGWGDDFIKGDAGNDTIYGDQGNDRLYGGEGGDSIYAGDGNDGLFGGGLTYADWLNGGAGFDRFLTQNGDVVHDLASTDARVNFQNGQQRTVSINGQPGSYTYAAGNWSDADVETVDIALNVLHQATGNTRLLKRPNRSELTFTRQGNQISSTGGTFNADAWNNNGNIYVVNPLLNVLLHEVGHNWDSRDPSGWQALSGWTRQDMSTNPSYQAGTGGGWWHLRTAMFANAYARTNPFEDFAMSFEVNMLNRGGLPNTNAVVAAKNAYIDNLVSSLAAQA